jgi:hypothetical protein
MERLNGNELRAALIEKNMINEAGAANTFTVNCISGAHTWPLLSETRNLFLNDLDAMEELQAFLNEVYEKDQFDIMIGILKIIYNFCGLPIPEAVQMIFDCDEKALKEIYLYEFLEDFQDIMGDFQTEVEEIR